MSKQSKTPNGDKLRLIPKTNKPIEKSHKSTSLGPKRSSQFPVRGIMIIAAALLAGAGAFLLSPAKDAEIDRLTATPGTPQTRETAQSVSNALSFEATATQKTPGQPQTEQSPLDQAANLKAQSIAVAQSVVTAFPEEAISYALLGSAYFNVGQSEEAITHLHRCLELDPKQIDAYEILARIAYDKGNLDEAIEHCRQGLEHGGNHPMILDRLGRSLLDSGITDDAVMVLDRSSKLPSATAETFYLLGQAHLQSATFDKARESFEQAVLRSPDHTQAFFGLFTACLRQGQMDEATRFRERFLALEKENRESLTERSAEASTLSGLPLVQQTVAKTLFGAAQIFRSRGNTKRCEELLVRASTVDPNNMVSRQILESMLAQRKASSEAITIFRSLAEAQPKSSLNHLFLGRVYKHRQEFEPAKKAFRQSITLDPERAESYQGLTELYFTANREISKTPSLTRKLIELEPNHGPNYYLRAFSLIRNGDREGAIAAMERGIAIAPGNPKFENFLQKLKDSP